VRDIEAEPCGGRVVADSFTVAVQLRAPHSGRHDGLLPFLLPPTTTPPRNRKLQLPLHHIRPIQPHMHSIPNRISLPIPLPNNLSPILVIPVPIPRQSLNRHQSLHKQIRQLHKEPILRRTNNQRVDRRSRRLAIFVIGDVDGTALGFVRAAKRTVCPVRPWVTALKLGFCLCEWASGGC